MFCFVICAGEFWSCAPSPSHPQRKARRDSQTSSTELQEVLSASPLAWWQLQIWGSRKWIKRTCQLRFADGEQLFLSAGRTMAEMIQSLIETINTANRLSTGRDFKWKQAPQFLWLRLSKRCYRWHRCHKDNQIASFVFGSCCFVIFLLLLVLQQHRGFCWSTSPSTPGHYTAPGVTNAAVLVGVRDPTHLHSSLSGLVHRCPDEDVAEPPPMSVCE